MFERRLFCSLSLKYKVIVPRLHLAQATTTVPYTSAPVAILFYSYPSGYPDETSVYAVTPSDSDNALTII